MDLNNLESFNQLDSEKYIQQIYSMPAQLETAWTAGMGYPLSLPRKPKQIVICGMGGSAIGGDLVASYVKRISDTPIFICRDYYLPQWALNSETLVIASTYSGNTEETISAFEQAKGAGCILMALTRGGIISEFSQNAGTAVWSIGHSGQPRAAVPTSFGLICVLLYRLGIIDNIWADIQSTVNLLDIQQAILGPESPVNKNPAKRLAGQLFGRMIGIVGSDLMAPVAVRWVGQINELSKAWAQALILPEMDHNILAGILNPSEQLSNLAVVFLKSMTDHPRNTLRSDLTRELLMVEGINTDVYQASGVSDLEQLWSAIQFGDFTAYYLAMMYGVDPTPIPAIEQLKIAMKH
jgi:glucose/mannose-6-phosphate isomerase